jgi:hypothetical protein
MTEVQPLPDEEIDAIERHWQSEGYAQRSQHITDVLGLIATIRQRTEQREQAMAAATQATADAEFSTRHWGEALRDVWPVERERAEALRQRDEALAERDKWFLIAAQMEQDRDEAVALLADVEAYFDEGVRLNDLISYALCRAAHPGA